MTKLEKVLFIVVWIILMYSVLSNIALERKIKELEEENKNLKNNIVEVM